MQCSRCGAPDVQPPVCDVCGAPLPVVRAAGRGQRGGQAPSGAGRLAKPGTLASFFSATAKRPAGPDAAGRARPRISSRPAWLGGAKGQPPRPDGRRALPQFPAMHAPPGRASGDDAAPPPNRGGTTGDLRGARARAPAREAANAHEAATKARMPASRPSLRDDVPGAWDGGARADPTAGGYSPPTPTGRMAGTARQRTQRVPAPPPDDLMMPGPPMPRAASGPMMAGMAPGTRPRMAIPGDAQRAAALPRAGIELSHKALSALVIAGVVIVLAIPVLFGLSRISALTPPSQPLQAAATRVPPAQAPSGFTSFVADTYSVAYPAGWSHSSKSLAMSQGGALADVFGDGQGTQATIAIVQPLPTNQLQMVVDDVAQRYFPPNLPETLGGAGPRAYGGVTWAAGDYTVATGSLGSQTIYELRVLVANFGAQTVVVVLQATQKDFTSAESSGFRPLIQSFRFG